MIEEKIATRLRIKVEQLGGKAYKLDSEGNNGMPDRLVCLPCGIAVLVETKKPKGGRLTKIQKYRHDELQRMGIDVRVISTYDEIDAFLREVIHGV